MSNKITCSFPEFNFPNLPLLVKGIEMKNCSVKYAVSLQIIALSKFGCIAHWLFLLTNKTAATTKPKLTSSCVRLTLRPPYPPRPSSVCAYLFSRIQRHLELKAYKLILNQTGRCGVVNAEIKMTICPRHRRKFARLRELTGQCHTLFIKVKFPNWKKPKKVTADISETENIPTNEDRDTNRCP